MADNGATNISKEVVSAITDSGPAKALSGLVDSITTGIKSLTSGFDFMLSSAGKGLVETDVQLPIANPLHNYATYDYVLSLGCLDTDSFNHPATSYIIGKYPPWICKSANGDPNNRIKMTDGKKYDFFIEDLSITTNSGFVDAAGNTNNTTITFSVIEPYSMGMFMVALQTAAYEQGHVNWRDGQLLLMIEFRGNKETGQMTTIPNTTRYLPMQLTKCAMSVNEAGARWNLEAHTSSGEAFNDCYKNLQSDATISGKTVQEILQSGEKSLQQVINARFKEAVKLGTVKVSDEIVILFPEAIATTAPGSTNNTSGTGESTQTAVKKPTQTNESDIYKTLGISRNSSTSALVQSSTSCNAIGKASLDYNATRGGISPFSRDDAVWDEVGKIYKQSEIVPTPGVTDFKFPQNSDIINAINQVILKSQIALEALDPEQVTPTGMRPWFRVDSQVYQIASNANMQTTGEKPKLIVYRVVPYMCHAANLLPPNVPTPGLVELKKEIVKEYNYIYTGKNVDIIRFDFEMNQAFYNEMSADQFTSAGDVVTAGQTSTTVDASKQGGSLVVPKGDGNLKQNAANVPTKFVNKISSSDNKGGARGETAATRAARLFHDAVTNSMDMQQLSADIVGDPYYIAGSGCGNYTDVQLTKTNITQDGSMNYQNGEIHVVFNFRTPTDVNQTTGMYDLKNSELCQQFSGVFKLISVISNFKQGEFIQTLNANRIQGQDSKAEPKSNVESMLTSKTAPSSDTTGTATAISSYLNTSVTQASPQPSVDPAAASITPTFSTPIGGA